MNPPTDKPNPDPIPVVPPDGPLEFELDCINCGYNLRGLSGDPIRCPECFHEYSRAVISEHLALLNSESELRRTLNTIVVSLIAGGLGLLFSFSGGFVVMLAAFVMLWLSHADLHQRFAKRKGWHGVVFDYLFYTALIPSVFLSALLLPGLAGVNLMKSLFPGYQLAAMAVGFLCACIGLLIIHLLGVIRYIRKVQDGAVQRMIKILRRSA